MNNYIHPTALVSPTAQFGKDNFIGPFCIVGPNVVIGDSNRFEAYCSVGTAGEHRDYLLAEPGAVLIGNHNVIREYVTVSGGTDSTTQIGSHVSIFRGTYIGHDANVRDRANLSCNVLVAGHTIIGEGANLGLAAAIHQHRAIGAYSMIGMNSTVTRHCAPFLIAFGTPLRPGRVNRIGLQRAGVTEAELIQFETWFQDFEETGTMPQLVHSFSPLLDQFLADCRSFQRPTPAPRLLESLPPAIVP